MRQMPPRFQRFVLFALLLLLGGACATAPDPPAGGSLQAAPRSLEVRLEIAPRSAVVELETRRPAAGRWRFAAREEAYALSWYDMRAYDAAGRPLEVTPEEDGTAWTLTAPAEGGFTLRYLVVAPAEASSPAQGAQTARQRFAGFGAALFVQPTPPEGGAVDEVGLELKAPEGWSLRSTWGPQRARLAGLNALDDGLVVAGAWSLDRAEIQRSALFVAVDTQLPEGAPAWTPPLERIAEAQASYFGTYPINALMIALVPATQGEVEASATAGGLLVEVPAGWSSPEDPRVLRRVAREHLRMFTERWMHPRATTPEEPPGAWPAWFTEGAAEYYGARTLLSLKLLDGKGFLDLLNNWIAQEAQSRWSQQALPDPERQSSWQAPDAVAYARARGALLAFLLDVTLRTDSQGLTSLDHLLRRMGFDFGGSEAGYTEADVLQRLQAFTRRDLSELITRCVQGREPLPLDYLDRGGVLMETAPGERFDPGFTWEAFEGEPREARFIVRTVEPDGPAARAGLAEGELLASLEITSTQVLATRLLQRPEGEDEPGSPHARFERAPIAFSPLRQATLPRAAATTELFEEWFRR